MAAHMAVSETLSTFDATSAIHGYHYYKDVWTAVIGEQRNCEREFGNRHDSFAVAIMKDGQVVGHVPRTISCMCTLFIRRGGSILAIVIGARRRCTCRGVDNGGVELPCVYRFAGPSSFTRKTQRALADEDDISHISDVTEMQGKLLAASWACIITSCSYRKL